MYLNEDHIKITAEQIKISISGKIHPLVKIPVADHDCP